MTPGRVLIPCGGRGTRMMSLTGGSPKELLKVGGVATVVRVLEESAESGLDEALVVVSPEKQEIVDLLSRLKGRAGLPRSISFVTQPEPRGLADAIRMGRGFAGGDPLAVALPDNLFAGADPGISQVIDTFTTTGKNVVAVVEITAADASRRGPTSAYPGRTEGTEYIIHGILGKTERGRTFDTGGAGSAFTGVGRYVLTAEVFDAIDAVDSDLPPGEELDDVPVMQRLLSHGLLTGRRITGLFFDVGIEAGFREADEYFAANRHPATTTAR